MAITLPSDVFTRNFLRPTMSYQWFKSIALLKGFMGNDANAPLQVDDGAMALGMGNYSDQPILAPITSLLQTRDIANGGSTLTAAKITTRNENGVYVRFTALVNIGEDAGRLSAAVTMERLAQHMAEQSALEFLAKIQNYAIGIAKAAVGSMSATPHTKSVYVASGSKVNLSSTLLVQGQQLFGDKLQSYMGANKGVWVTRSGPLLDLNLNQLSSGVQGIADGVVKTGLPSTLGVPYVVADDASLTATNGGNFDKYGTLGMGPGAIRVKVEEPRFYLVDQRLDTVVVSNFLRCDMDAYFQIPGKQWDITNGGVNPTFSAITTGSNWDDQYVDAREVPLIYLEHNSSLS